MAWTVELGEVRNIDDELLLLCGSAATPTSDFSGSCASNTMKTEGV